jgi:hypothetical protein
MNQVVKKKETSVAIADLVSKNAGTGFENVTGVEDLALPFLKVLSPSSPELNKSKGKYIEGAQAGNLVNTVTKEIFDGEKGIKVIPCFYNREYIEWAEMGTGPSAPINIYPKESDIMTKTKPNGGKDWLENGNYVEDTRSHFVLVLDDNYNYVCEALMIMKGSNRKVSKNWMSQQMMKKLPDGRPLPSYGFIYTAKSKDESNKKGAWNRWEIEADKMVDNVELFKKAEGFYLSMKKGEKTVDHGAADGVEETSAPTASVKSNDDIPF